MTTINLKQLKKADLVCIGILITSTLFVIFLLTRNQYLFGSTTDWINQHTVIPEYFRNLFYETGKLFPEFAPNLGGGQNIFHFSYYGYFSPIILVSYLFPNISMADYIALSSIFLLLVSGSLCYYWLRKHHLSYIAAFTAAFLFQFSAPMLYHSHKQIMFVNYMPFLLLALLGVDSYFEKKKSFSLIFYTLLMILTSYFYSVGGILVITIYAIYQYWKRNSTSTWKDFFKNALAFALRIIISIGISALLIFPSFYAILNGRSKDTVKSSISFMELFFPKLVLENLLYSPYGIGLTSISLFAVFYFLWKKEKAEKILTILISTIFLIPIFLFALNGGLYLRGKVFIPFLPLMALLIGLFLEDCRQYEKHSFVMSKALHYFILFFLLLIVFDHTLLSLAFFLEGGIFLLCYKVFCYKKVISYLCIPTIFLCFILCIGVNLSDTLVSKDLAKKTTSKEVKELIDLALSEDGSALSRMNIFLHTKENVNRVPDNRVYLTSIYSSTYQGAYNKFHKSLIGNADFSSNSISCEDSNNILFQTFMGVKYIISSEHAPIGYKQIAQKGEYYLYKNEAVFPIAYANSDIMEKENFESLSSVQKQIALLTHVQVDKISSFSYPNTFSYQSPFIEESISLPIERDKDNIYYYNSSKPLEYHIPVSARFQKQIHLLEFQIEDLPEKEAIVNANGIFNRLTGKSDIYPNGNSNFSYVLSDINKKQAIDLSFSSGDYHFSSLHLYTLDYETILKASKNLVPFSGTRLGTKNKILQGNIKLEKDGYFVTSIPYDKGFCAYVDGVKQPIEMINTAFLGFPLKEGEHTIQLTYHAPFFFLGKIISLSFVLFFITLTIFEITAERNLFHTIPKNENVVQVIS